MLEFTTRFGLCARVSFLLATLATIAACGDDSSEPVAIAPGTSSAANPSSVMAPVPTPTVPSAPNPSAGCSNTCVSAHDGECDDGGPGSLYDVCGLGTDCADCGSRLGQMAPSASAGCTNTCASSFDGECDDGGPNSVYDLCSLGTDCADCGNRVAVAPSPAPSGSAPSGAAPFVAFEIRSLDSTIRFNSAGEISVVERFDGAVEIESMGRVLPDGRWLQEDMLIGVLRETEAEYFVDGREVVRIDAQGVAGEGADRDYFNEEGFYVDSEIVLNTPEERVQIIPHTLPAPARRIAAFLTHLM